MQLGLIIKRERLNRKLTVEGLAEQLNISSAYLSRLENNKRCNPSVDILRKLENKFNMTLIQEVYIPANILDISITYNLLFIILDTVGLR